MNELTEVQEPILTVTQLTDQIKSILEGNFNNISLKGEISNFRPNASGHLYFVLKDANCQISAVMFRGKASYLSFTPKDGMLVQVRGSISVYGPRGNYQIMINSMSPFGEGDIMEMIEERKKRLAAEGLFDSSRKKPIPYFPETVGIVTSPTGAALRDVIRIARNRNCKVNIVVFPALVQGESAASSITKMIKIANLYNMCDVLIVGRGGGSLEDLLPFSDEELVRTIANSDIPIVSAVGHEIDWALSDYAADVRASTPSNAAELVFPLLQDIEQGIISYKEEMYNTIYNLIKHYKLMVERFTPENMELKFRSIEQPYLVRFDDAKKALIDNMTDRIQELKNNIKTSLQILDNCNPQAILDRGYSMVTDSQTGKVIRFADEVQEGTMLAIKPCKGTINATVNNIIP